MILSTRKTNVFLCKNPTDMRLSYSGLSDLVKKAFSRSPYNGQYYAFVNRRRTSCKVYTWDGSGEVILMKRLSGGQFCRPNPTYKKQLRLTATEFSQFFEGLNMGGRLLESVPNQRPSKRRVLRFVPPYRTLSAYDGGGTRVHQPGQPSQGLK